jgi:hypothetical protein
MPISFFANKYTIIIILNLTYGKAHSSASITYDGTWLPHNTCLATVLK